LNNVQLQRVGNPNWARNATLRRFIDSLEPAKGRSAGPILLLQGERDQTVPVEVTTGPLPPPGSCPSRSRRPGAR
jgi:pimeloyl-ACP methyl ester carboxylesterase